MAYPYALLAFADKEEINPQPNKQGNKTFLQWALQVTSKRHSLGRPEVARKSPGRAAACQF
jgi:hypothetical protein